MAPDHQLQQAAQMVAHHVWVWMVIACACMYSSSQAAEERELMVSASGLAADLRALLAIKQHLTLANPSLNLSDWASNSSSPCSWRRITCSPSPWLANQTRVTSLDLSFLALHDPLPSAFSNLLALSQLNLSNNLIAGPDLSQANLPNCTHLSSLDLSANNLSSLSILSNLTNMPSLQSLHLSKNKLVGSIPTSNICSSDSPSSSLHTIDLSVNNITGTFPLSFLQCLSLQNLDISQNSMTGSIPPQVGKMISLESLNLQENSFTGSLPAELGGLPNLKVFMAGSNSINGSIPPQLKNCKNLQRIALDSNHLQGTLPGFLGDMVSLEYIAFHDNNFSGTIPLALFNPSNKLKLLDVSKNSLSGQIPIQFANLTSLHYLVLAENNFTGAIPSEIGSITGLQILDLSSNHLTDQIPSSLGQLQHLLWLNLAFNNLTGPIPPELGNCTSLIWLNLKRNYLSGWLPSELSSMGMNPNKTFELNVKQDPPKNLAMCDLLKRWVPEDYPPFSFVYDVLTDAEKCKSYWLVLLTRSPFDGACSTIVTAKGYIQLSNNNLTGPILYNWQGNRTVFLLLSFNRFTGSLPSGLRQLPLITLNVSHNMLDGCIPESLADNKCLTSVDLSYNNLSGPIPASLGNLSQLSSLNLSFNPFLSGVVPSSGQFLTFNTDSYLNDSRLCFEVPGGKRHEGSPSTKFSFCNLNPGNSSGPEPEKHGRQSKGSSKKAESLLIAGILSCFSILLCGAIALRAMWKWPNYRSRGMSLRRYGDDDVDDVIKRDNSKSTVCFFEESGTDGGRKSPVTDPVKAQFTYKDLMLATNNFSDEHVIGCGGFGTVYKAKLRDGSMVAIKKLIERGTSEEGEREFMAEMETLGTITHENLVPLIACCRWGSEKLLVYKLMSNGSLEDWLHGEEAERERDGEKLSWDIRLKIARGCAKALGYLHQECRIIHRDVKGSNVLLDEDFTAYVTDFGLAREFPPGFTHVSTMIAGTLGYVAPEYCHTWRATPKGDVYSFGVVLLELLTGQPPVTFSAPCDGCLVDWVRLLDSQSRPAETWHPVVRRTAAGRFHQVLTFMRLALACTSDRPDQRPSMPEVAHTLEAIQ